ncbi:hypothetical protein KCP73_03640 [Salmonella enterica subsp. enterica]|nr:hypothetical protein KCP73_03640 [Salmonella enterica subsp. enterica]
MTAKAAITRSAETNAVERRRKAILMLRKSSGCSKGAMPSWWRALPVGNSTVKQKPAAVFPTHK